MQSIKDIGIILSSIFHIYPAIVYPIKGGWSALAYFVEDKSGKRFLMKVYEKARSSTAKLTANIEYYMPIVDWLNANTLLHDRIVKPIKTESGKYRHENDDYVFLLFQYIEGSNITKEKFTDKQVIQLADILSVLHSYGENIPFETQSIKETFDIEFCIPLGKVIQQKDSLKIELCTILSQYSVILENAIEKLRTLSEEFIKLQSKHVLCHTDVHEGNILQTREGVVLID